jgi:hypothetical protein
MLNPCSPKIAQDKSEPGVSAGTLPGPTSTRMNPIHRPTGTPTGWGPAWPSLAHPHPPVPSWYGLTGKPYGVHIDIGMSRWFDQYESKRIDRRWIWWIDTALNTIHHILLIICCSLIFCYSLPVLVQKWRALLTHTMATWVCDVH